MDNMLLIREQGYLYNFIAKPDAKLIYTYPCQPGLRAKFWQYLKAILQEYESPSDSGIKAIAPITQIIGQNP